MTLPTVVGRPRRRDRWVPSGPSRSAPRLATRLHASRPATPRWPRTGWPRSTPCKALAGGDVDFLREGVRVLAQGSHGSRGHRAHWSPPGERDPETRLTHRNGYRERGWDTRVGTIPLASHDFATARTSRACSTRGDVPSGPCSRWSARHTSRVSPRGGSTTSSAASGSAGSARARCPVCAPRSMPR